MTLVSGNIYGAQMNRVSIKATGVAVTVDNNPIARLSYYLNCIQVVTSLNFGRLAEYKNFRSFDSEDRETIVQLCDLISPDVLVEANAFVLVGNNAHERDNEFYELNAQRLVALRSSSITIGSLSGRITKIMSFKKSWLINNYIDPMNTIRQQKIEAERRRRRMYDSDSDSDSCVIF